MGAPQGILRAAWLGTGVWLLSGCFPEMPTLEPRGSEPDSGPVLHLDGMAPDGPLPDGALSADDGASVDSDPGSMGETCDGADDDGDGRVDEGFEGLDDPCAAGVGACRVEGRMRCAADGQAVACDAVASGPLPELCNGIDDDCSGQIDEGFEQVGMGCEVGEGPCAAAGTLGCSVDGRAVVCDATPLDVARLEGCNGVDDDCDGLVDEMLVRQCELEDRPPVCRSGTSLCVGGVWSPCEGSVPLDNDRPDVCNGIDDDCDRVIDEDVLRGGIGMACQCEGGPLRCLDASVLECDPVGGYARQCDPEDPLATVCAPRPEEVCDGQDENCDGVVDGGGVCDRSLAEACAVWFGWTTRALPSPSDDWGDCEALGGIGDDISCNWTRRADDFVSVALVEGADVDAEGARLGMSIRCGADPVGAYVTNHCRVFLGVGIADAAPGDGAEAWGPCPAMPVGGDERIACAGSVPGGGFRPLPVPFDLTADTLVGVAFICEDPADPVRAATMQAAVEISLAWVDGQYGPEEPDFRAICVAGGDGDPYSACATTSGDGRFYSMRLTADVDAGDRFALRIRPGQR